VSAQLRMLPVLNGREKGRHLLIAAVALVLTSFAFAAPPAIQIPRIDTPPLLSDFEDMQPSSRVVGQMVKVTGFIAREPADGHRSSRLFAAAPGRQPDAQ